MGYFNKERGGRSSASIQIKEVTKFQSPMD